MKMLPAEFPNKPGIFRLKPAYKLPKHCPLCGSLSHIGKTTCEVRMHWQTDAEFRIAKQVNLP